VAVNNVGEMLFELALKELLNMHVLQNAGEFVKKRGWA
jgi:hypothetical protein